jgi:hypothetical protein
VCRACNQHRPNEGRGLCGQCYQRYRRSGLLDQFKRTLHRSIGEWLAEIDTADASACWPWPASVSEDGYGIVWVAPRMRPAHRVVYEHLVGPIPVGLTLDHVCHDSDECRAGVDCPHRRCVNPAHLTPATHLDNARRSLAGRATCGRGHAQTPDNVYKRDGRTWCAECRRTRARQKQHDRRRTASLRTHILDGHCINGHEMTPENTYIEPKTGYSECYVCRRVASRRYYERNREKVLARRAARR